MLRAIKSEPMEQSDLIEDPFVYYVGLPSLQMMASYKVVLSMWLDYISRSNNDNETEITNYLNDGIFPYDNYAKLKEEIKNLNVTESLQRIIGNSLYRIVNETQVCMKFFRNELFSNNLMRFKIDRFNPKWWVWLPNGHIDYEKSAIKILSTMELSEIQEFAVMSKFCLKNEIQRISLYSIPQFFIDQVIFTSDPLLYYWISYLKNIIHKIPLDGYRTIDIAMAIQCKNETWSAFRYFWNHLNTEDQVFVASVCLKPSFQGPLFPRRVLSAMTLFQQQLLLHYIPERIILLFCNDWKLSRFAFWAWRNSKYTMSAEQFAEIVKTIIECDFLARDKLMSILIEMWDTARDVHKKFVVQTLEPLVIDRFTFYNGCKDLRISTAFEFLYKFLSMKDVEGRREFILRNALNFAFYPIIPYFVNEVLNLCLPSPDDLLNFKKIVTDAGVLKKLSFTLFCDSNFEELILLLKFYLPDSNSIRKFVTSLLLTNEFTSMTGTDFWNKLNKFIDEVCFECSSLSFALKKQFISSYLEEWFNGEFYNLEKLEDMMEIFKSMFSYEEWSIVKHVFSRCFQTIFTNREHPWWLMNFNESHLYKMITWCFDGLDDEDKAVEKFKRNVSVDALFDGIFYSLNEQYFEQPVATFPEALFSDFDKCLVWYLKYAEAVSLYKSNKAFDSWKIFESVTIWREDEFLKKLLTWFFEGNQAKIRQFKAKKLRIWKEKVDFFSEMIEFKESDSSSETSESGETD